MFVKVNTISFYDRSNDKKLFFPDPTTRLTQVAGYVSRGCMPQEGFPHSYNVDLPETFVIDETSVENNKCYNLELEEVESPIAKLRTDSESVESEREANNQRQIKVE